MDKHTHRHYRFGNTFHCICGDSRQDTRTEQERAADMDRATLAAKIRVNDAFGVASPNMSARLAELSK